MISLEDIRNLAQLARLKLTPKEEESLQKDISNILEYVGQVSSASAGSDAVVPEHHNVMREDAPAPVLGAREALVAAFPRSEKGYNVVRKIIEKDATE